MAHIDIDFISNVLSRAVKITLILPTKTAPTLEENYCAKTSTYYQDKRDKKYPLLILLHGLLNDCNNWLSYARAELYAEENNIAICTISGENKFYINYDEKDKFYDFIEYELKDFLYGNFNISPLSKDNFIAGLSMGGFGTLYHIARNPEAYAAAGAFSPAIYLKRPGFIKIDDVTKPLLENKDKLPPIFISVGSEDTICGPLETKTIYEQNIKFYNFCKKNGIKLDSKIIKGYSHEWRLWDMELERFIKWIPRSDDYKEESPRSV